MSGHPSIKPDHDQPYSPTPGHSLRSRSSHLLRFPPVKTFNIRGGVIRSNSQHLVTGACLLRSLKGTCRVGDHSSRYGGGTLGLSSSSYTAQEQGLGLREKPHPWGPVSWTCISWPSCLAPASLSAAYHLPFPALRCTPWSHGPVSTALSSLSLFRWPGQPLVSFLCKFDLHFS